MRLRRFVLLLFVTFPLFAATRTVDDDGPADFSSITAALAASSSGDVIQVAAGIYDESRETFPLELKSGVAILGAGRDTTTIRAGADDSAFSNEGTALSATTEVDGFTITQVVGADEGLMEFLLLDATMTPRIENNRFLGNDDESDSGIIVAADGGGGLFDGLVANNEFLSFGVATEEAPVTTQAIGEAAFGAGIVLGRFFEFIEEQLKTGGVTTHIAPPDEDRIEPEITGNRFEGSANGILVIGSNFDDCSCELSGIMSPDIDGNAFEANGIDVFLVYAAFGFREFSPAITGNTSTNPVISVASFPFPELGPVGPVGLKRTKDAIVQRRMSELRPSAQARRTVRLAGIAPADPTAVYDLTITGNTITDPAFAGMLLFQFMDAVDSLSVDVDISDNTIDSTESLSLGGIISGLFIDELTTLVPGAFTVADNAITFASDALVLQFGDSADGPFAKNVRTNVAAANDIQIVRNQLRFGERGMVFGSSGYTTMAPLVSCNVFANQSDVGAEIEESTDPNPDFGGGARLSPGLNSFEDNVLNMRNLDADQVKAENDYWDSVNPVAIDDSIEGDVDFSPFLLVAPVGCNVVVPPPGADLALAKIVTSSGPYFAGSDVTYQLTVTNNGPANATNVVITDPIPTGMQFVSASAGCSASPTTVTCTAATLAASAQAVFTLTLRAMMPGSFTNTATVDATEGDSVTANDTASAPAVVVGPAAVSPIPTASEWGLLLMGAMLALAGVWVARR